MSDVHDFSPHEIDTLAAVLDQVIPPSADGRLPGAGFVAHGARFGVVIRMLPGLDLGLAGGLAACDERARKRGAADYASLGDDDRLAVLNEVAAADGGFVPSLMFLAYATYYVEERVIAALDLEPRPPHPQGFTMPANDLGLLDPVRARGRLWRDA
jgi:hypothetical protein